jgi:hypothetical protein
MGLEKKKDRKVGGVGEKVEEFVATKGREGSSFNMFKTT